MTEAQKLLVLLDNLGVHICPLVRTVVDMEAHSEVVGEGDAIALLRMCARSIPRLTGRLKGYSEQRYVSSLGGRGRLVANYAENSSELLPDNQAPGSDALGDFSTSSHRVAPCLRSSTAYNGSSGHPIMPLDMAR